MKIVINRCHGGFGLSNEGFELLLQKKGIEFDKVPSKSWIMAEEFDYYKKGHAGEDEYYICYRDMCSAFENNGKSRSDPDLVAVVEDLGEAAYGFAAELKVVDVPDDVEWYIEEYDGIEWVAEKHRTWR
jgi:hypothetical protein